MDAVLAGRPSGDRVREVEGVKEEAGDGVRIPLAGTLFGK